MITTFTGQSFEATLEHAPSGLTGVMGVRILDNDGATVTPRTTVGVVEYPIGSGFYQVTLTAPSIDGQYSVMWDSDQGGVATPENSATEALVVQAAPIIGEAGDGPCTSWITGADVGVALGISPTPSDAATYAAWATSLLFQLSARRFAGGCIRTLRPCRAGCAHWAPPSWGNPVPTYGWDGGMWRISNRDTGFDDECGCGITYRVRLPYPTQRVIAVKIDGALISPTTYRLDGQTWLTRISGNNGWPLCQDLSLPDDTVGTFTVEVQYGAAAPVAGVEAAKALAVQLYRHDHPETGACTLPAGVTQIVRSGLTMTKQAVAQWVEGKTGVMAIDAFLAAYNPKGRRGRAHAWSPDLQLPARKVGP